jgi:putative flavoprotein involved in K+ transport
MVAFIEAYADAIQAPIRCGVEVTALRRVEGGSGFRAETTLGPIEAENVVVATGPFLRPLVPAHLSQEIGIFQLHASAYRSAGQIPASSVLVVGAGASGLQIADELLRAGRRVFLSVGRHARLPRRYRGRDQVWWRMEMGSWREPAERRGAYQGALAVTGAYGGYTVDFRDFAMRGVVLLGRAEGARDGVVRFAPDLAANLAAGDAAYRAFLDVADAHALSAGLDLPEEPGARATMLDPPCVITPIRELDLCAEGVGAVIWATGYALHLRWIHLPIFDAKGELAHRRGMTGVPGLYFLGLSWLSRRNSAFFNGVGDDAAYLADHLATTRTPASAALA